MPQPFLISSFSQGLFQYYSPWLAPKDAFTQSQNVTIQQGFITIRDGLDHWGDFFQTSSFLINTNQFKGSIPNYKPLSVQLFVSDSIYKQDKKGAFYLSKGSERLTATLSGNSLAITFQDAKKRTLFVSYSPQTLSPVRAIASFESQQPRKLGTIVFNDTDLCCFINGERTPNLFVKQYILMTGTSYTGVIPFTFDPQSFSISAKVNGKITTIYYSENFTPVEPFKSASLINNTLTVTLNNALGPNDRLYFNFIPQRLLSNANSAISWDSSRDLIVFTNNKDPITFLDLNDLTISRPDMPITTPALQKRFNQVKTAKAVKFFKNRLLLIAPTITGTETLQDGYWAQSVRWSSLFLDQNTENSYWNFTADQPGYGGEFSPDTNEEIIGCGNVKDKLVLWFSESSYALAPTTSPQVPFSIYKINSSLYSACTHSVTNTNTHTQILGQFGYIQSDGNYSERFDLDISETIKNINFDLHYKVSAHSFSDENYLITLLYPTKYPATSEPNAAIVYNIIDKSFTTLSFPVTQITALGSAKVSSLVIWGDMRNVLFTPAQAGKSFASYQHYSSTKYPIAGATDGHIYAFNDSPTDYNKTKDVRVAIPWFFKTARFSPFIEQGLAFILNFIDVYFEGQGAPLDIIIDIYINGRSSPAKSTDITLKADKGVQTFKRINIQINAFFVELVFKNNPGQARPPKLKILGIILWAEQAGEIKDCKYLQ